MGEKKKKFLQIVFRFILIVIVPCVRKMKKKTVLHQPLAAQQEKTTVIQTCVRIHRIKPDTKQQLKTVKTVDVQHVKVL